MASKASKASKAKNLNVEPRTIFCHDNLDVLQGINSECVDLIYLDPPFNKKKTFTAPIGSSAEGAGFRDIFYEEDIKDEWVKSIEGKNDELYSYLSGVKEFSSRYNYCYLVYMAIRLIECRRVLSDSGSIYLHCDPTMSHYLKVVLDCIFGEKNFRNEIIWNYRNRFSRRGGMFSWMSDTVFLYSKGSEYYFQNIPAEPSDRTKKSYARGWDAPGDTLLVYDKEKAQHKIKEYEAKGKQIKYSNPRQVNMGNVWSDINIINSQSKERTGYPTQKPLPLLERIIQASSREGDVVLDPFCGCATTCVAAEKLGRQWIGVDVSYEAHKEVVKRIENEVSLPLVKADPDFTTVPPKRSKDEPQDQSYVYIIGHPKHPGQFKVGIAKDPKRRLAQYQIGCPDRAYALLHKHLTPYYKEIEQHIHKKFNAKYEWVPGDIEAIIKAIKAADKKLAGGGKVT